MPHYYFDLYDGNRLVVDEFGVDLESLDEARDQAIALLPDLARDGISHGDEHDFLAIVRCREGHVRYEAKLSLRGRWIDPSMTMPRRHVGRTTH